jgi:nucleotide-binding universal stress UspA family protein
MAARDHQNRRFSGLTQNSRDNAHQLQVAWTFSTGVLRGHEAAPIVVGETMYLVTPHPNLLHALDLRRNGAKKWTYDPKTASEAKGEMRDALMPVVSDPSRNGGVSASVRVEPGMAASAVRRCAEARERASRRLQEKAQAAGLSCADYLTRVQRGDASRRILCEEANWDCDLIVVGKHETNVIEELLIGSATSRVLSGSRSDVLVVVGKRAPADAGITL